MTVVSMDKDVEALSLTVVAEFDADVERVWKIWEDPRQLERWWTHATVRIEAIGDRTRMTITSNFESEEQLQKMVDMGMEEGMREALGQVDAILAERSSV